MNPRALVLFTLSVSLLASTACKRKECPPTPSPPAPAAVLDCGALGGDNAVQREMRMLECTLQRAVAAIARNDLAAVPPAIERLHEAKAATEEALHSGAYKPVNGDVSAFVALDEAFHGSLVQLVTAASANDHAATAAAMGTVLAGCQGCHATFRPTPPAAPAP